MPTLVIDAALSRCTVALVADDGAVTTRLGSGTRDQAAQLATLLAELLQHAALQDHSARPTLVAATVGPGSFTGLRAGLSLAHGYALAAELPMVGVTVGEALADSLPHLGGRPLWVVTDTRRGGAATVFLERLPAACDQAIASVLLEALPALATPVALAGDAAIAVAGRLAARGDDVLLTDARFPQPRHIAVVAQRRARGELPPLTAMPLYVDPPAVRTAAARPPPA